ncbi:aminoglycoside phosphotransferase family protein [Streptomyces hainanensis]|uniref:Hydroxyurea phosphotransferase n=1 Tax=Streptomyces hainanensis TaxID=402648 RepID=A0A4R4TKF9_9ACTN|nr:aminoglycoside phosphotransferase family protein [Streptomyces hainanensis]TDC76284.1 hydroxyurea phosphotransferase [Streptomyces hainanensis]
MTTSTSIDVPGAFAASYGAHGAEERAWLAELPRLGAELLDRWDLRPDGASAFGMASLVLPVRRADGTPAVLKLQQLRAETAGAAAGLRVWDGAGIVRLLEHDEPSSCQLLERLDAARPLSAVPDDREALRIIAGLLARLTAVPAPPGVRRLADIATDMLDQSPAAAAALADPAERALVRHCAAAVAELVGEAGDRLLHWDLHYDNVLAAEREPWLAIDPEPLAGDPGFDLLPALDNRWDEVVAGGDVARAVRYRFDLLTEALDLDRDRAVGWTLGRVLQNSLWDVEDGKPALDPVQVAIAHALSPGAAS